MPADRVGVAGVFFSFVSSIVGRKAGNLRARTACLWDLQRFARLGLGTWGILPHRPQASCPWCNGLFASGAVSTSVDRNTHYMGKKHW